MATPRSHRKKMNVFWLLVMLGLIHLLLVAPVVLGIILWQKIQYDRTIKALTSMVPQQVTTFRIYPRVGGPFGTPTEFKAPNPIIDDFFKALIDFDSYSPSHDTAWQEQQWFLEVYAKGVGKMIPISFYIPYPAREHYCCRYDGE